jgi:hypothetical protein
MTRVMVMKNWLYLHQAENFYLLRVVARQL